MEELMVLIAAARTGKPILLKRGLSMKIEEWLLAGEYVLANENPNLLFCERGIRTFETYTRNTLDISAVPVLKELTHLPVIVDPKSPRFELYRRATVITPNRSELRQVVGRSEPEDAAVEGERVAVARLHLAQVHHFRLERVEHLHADLDQFREEFLHLAAGVDQYGLACLPGRGVHLRDAWFDEPAP